MLKASQRKRKRRRDLQRWIGQERGTYRSLPLEREKGQGT